MKPRPPSDKRSLSEELTQRRRALPRRGCHSWPCSRSGREGCRWGRSRSSSASSAVGSAPPGPTGRVGSRGGVGGCGSVVGSCLGWKGRERDSDAVCMVQLPADRSTATPVHSHSHTPWQSQYNDDTWHHIIKLLPIPIVQNSTTSPNMATILAPPPPTFQLHLWPGSGPRSPTLPQSAEHALLPLTGQLCLQTNENRHNCFQETLHRLGTAALYCTN